MSVNKVTLLGRLGQDPEIKRTNNGSAFANISVATSERWRDKATGERKEKTEWTKCVIWNENLVSIAEQYLRKGTQVYLEGKLQTRKWQDQNGNERYATEVVLTGYDCKLEMVGGRGDNGGDGGRDSGGRGERSSGGRSQSSRRDDMDDDIPF